MKKRINPSSPKIGTKIFFKKKTSSALCVCSDYPTTSIFNIGTSNMLNLPPLRYKEVIWLAGKITIFSGKLHLKNMKITWIYIYMYGPFSTHV